MSIRTELFNLKDRADSDKAEIQNDITKWKKQHGTLLMNFRKFYESKFWPNETLWPRRLTKRNMDSMFIHIYSFREIVLKIDLVIENNMNKTYGQPDQIGGGHVKNKKILCVKLIDQWDKCERVDFTASEREKLGIRLLDIYRIKYINYMAFIYRLLNNEKIVISYDYTEELV